MPNRNIILTAGWGQYISTVWHPSLRHRGKYEGDVIIIDFDKSCGSLREQKNVIVIDSDTRMFQCLANERHRIFHEILHDIRDSYDVAMVIDGNDVEFFKPIQPLLDMATDQLCYVTELIPNERWIRLETVPDAELLWNSIKDKPIVNCGMFTGPINQIYETLQYMTEGLRHRSDFGYDQLLFNALIYHYKIPAKHVNRTWNYVVYDAGRGCTIHGDECYGADGEPIAILHKV